MARCPACLKGDVDSSGTCPSCGQGAQDVGRTLPTLHPGVPIDAAAAAVHPAAPSAASGTFLPGAVLGGRFLVRVCDVHHAGQHRHHLPMRVVEHRRPLPPIEVQHAGGRPARAERGAEHGADRAVGERVAGLAAAVQLRVADRDGLSFLEHA